LRTVRHQNGTLDGVIKFAHISRPPMIQECLLGSWVNPGDPLSIPASVTIEKMLG
jgi:hypothetical protein